jgi:hypothetical protein
MIGYLSRGHDLVIFMKYRGHDFVTRGLDKVSRGHEINKNTELISAYEILV